jgi:hypothetical protein
MAVLYARALESNLGSEYWTQQGHDVTNTDFWKNHNSLEGINVEIVKAIGRIDRFGSSACKDEMAMAGVEEIRAVCASRSMTTEQQVMMVYRILRNDVQAVSDCHELVMESRAAWAKAMSASNVTMHGAVAVVESSHMMATQVGYSHADVVVAVNPTMLKDFKDPSKGTYLKYTVCKRDDHVPYLIDFQALNALENGWGGRPTIGGSPQGTDSCLTLEQVLSCIKPV